MEENKKSFLKPALVALGLLLAVAVIALNVEVYQILDKEQRIAASERTQVRLSFSIENLQTNLQVPGQRNTVRVTYEYKAHLEQPEATTYNPKWVLVPGVNYPYFEGVRDDIARYLLNYPTKEDFYEVILQNLAQYILTSYPQIGWIEIVIEAPPGEEGAALGHFQVTVVKYSAS